MDNQQGGFKKNQRKAHTPKFKKDKKKLKRKPCKKRNPSSSDTEDEDSVKVLARSVRDEKRRLPNESPENEAEAGESAVKNPTNVPSAPIASGVADNTGFTLPPSQEHLVEANPLKMKIKTTGLTFYDLRASTKLGELKEDLINVKNLRQNELLHEKLFGTTKNAEARRARDRAKKAAAVSSKVVQNAKGNHCTETHSIVQKESGQGQGQENIAGFEKKKFSEIENPPPEAQLSPFGRTLDWDEYLASPPNLQSIPPVTYFKQAPFFDKWKKIAIPGIFIELRNPYVHGQGDFFWIGRIVHFAGYKGLVKFETFEDAPCDDDINYLVWISFCSKVPRSLGWCAKNRKKLIPGPIVSSKVSPAALKKKLVDFYSQSNPTIEEDHESLLRREFEIVKKTWKPEGKYEALDLVRMDQNRLVRVAAIAGNRVNFQYRRDPKIDTDAAPGDDDHDSFWFHWKSDLIHRFMWSHTVGVALNGINPNFRGAVLPPESFPTWPEDTIQIKVGMRLETRHPYLTHKIVGAVIIKVLKFGYFTVQTQDIHDGARVSFVYHVTSPFIFPVGFGKKHNIPVEFAMASSSGVETGKNGTMTEASPCMRLDLLPPRAPHKFRVGFKLEAIEVTTSASIGPATIAKVAGHLLFIYFDGWRRDILENHQWVDAFESEIYPVGYCELMGFDWQGRVGIGSTAVSSL